ncbi:MAG: hypothetical protein CL917_11100 [Deltaproteobacteria bacterium]|nr:hypothetical protein [Deltaproteobacteria bacterium]
MLSRTYLGILILLAFGAFVVYLAAGQFDSRCHVCMRFNGQIICETALASDPSSAQMQATGSACSQLSRGVTDSFNCTAMAPISVKCE